MPPELQSALSQVIAEGRFIKGWEVAAFEKELCLELQTHSVVTTGNGTDALLACLMALDLREGDEVITPAYGYPAAVEMMCLLGLKPVLVDVNWQTFNIEAGLLKDAVSSKTKAILPIHLFGLPASMDDILHFAEQHGLPVIEDAAQCLGAEVEIEGTRRKAGTAGRLGCTSFFPTKNLG
uniref:DegT/DnrJ/EryC1/StrS family aminotransferase n=1 Tax=Parasutterella excrementihominis TaxID=487175 RepID=UPI003FF03CC3